MSVSFSLTRSGMAWEISDPAELARLRKALLDHCRQDTLGLVRLLENMRGIQ